MFHSLAHPPLSQRSTAGKGAKSKRWGMDVLCTSIPHLFENFSPLS